MSCCYNEEKRSYDKRSRKKRRRRKTRIERRSLSNDAEVDSLESETTSTWVLFSNVSIIQGQLGRRELILIENSKDLQKSPLMSKVHLQTNLFLFTIALQRTPKVFEFSPQNHLKNLKLNYVNPLEESSDIFISFVDVQYAICYSNRNAILDFDTFRKSTYYLFKASWKVHHKQNNFPWQYSRSSSSSNRMKKFHILCTWPKFNALMRRP